MKRIVIMGAHPDDIELGCGGTLHQLKELNPVIVIFTDTVETNGNNIIEELQKSMSSYNLKYELYDFPNMGLVNNIPEVRTKVFNLKSKGDIFFGPSTNSQHLDHRVLGRAIDDIMLEMTVYFYEDIRSGQN